MATRLPMLGVPGVLGGGAGPYLFYVNESPSAITPTVGAEMLTNAVFSAWTGDDPDDYTITGESGSDPEVSEVGTTETHGGSGTGSCNLYSSGTVNRPIVDQSNALNPASLKWLQNIVVISAITGTLRVGTLASSYLERTYTTTGTKTMTEMSLRTTARMLATTPPSDITVDSWSYKTLTDVMVAEAANAPVLSYGYNHWAINDAFQAGGYLAYDANNYVMWFASRLTGNVHLYKNVAGTLSEVTNAAFTYDATKAIYFRHPEDNRWLIGYDTPANIEAYSDSDWVDNALIDDSTVTDATLNDDGLVYDFGALSSNSGNTPQIHKLWTINPT